MYKYYSDSDNLIRSDAPKLQKDIKFKGDQISLGVYRMVWPTDSHKIYGRLLVSAVGLGDTVCRERLLKK